MEKFKEMGTGSTGRLLLKYSLPAIAGMVLVSLYNVIDRIFVGQATGSLGLAAVTVAFPVMMLGFAPALLANAGGSSRISRLLGAGDKEGAEKALGQAVLLGAVLSGLTGLLCLPFLDQLLRLFGASDATLAPARAFCLLMIVAFPFQGAGMGLATGVRSQGKAKTSMFLILVGVGLNAVLCGVFVLGMGWGVVGSAWATLISQVFGMLLSIAYYTWGGSALRFRPKYLAWNEAAAKDIMAVGFGSWLMNVIPVILFIILNNVMARFAGDVGIAMIGIVNTVSMLAVMPIIGIMQGAAPIMGYNHGSGDSVRVRRVFLQAFLASTAILALFWAAIELFPNAFILAFSAKDPELLALGQRGLAIFLLLLPSIGLPIALTQYYQSVGKGLPATLLGMSRQVIFLIPALLILPLWWGVDGIIWAGPVSDALGVLLSLGFLLHALPRMARVSEAGGNRQSDPVAEGS